MLAVLFWCLFLLITLHYVGYPALVIGLAILKRKVIAKSDGRPKVSLIIAAYNEADVIDEKLQNALSLEYPRDQLEIIVVSDGSSDGTETRVQRYEHQGVISLFQPMRRGKSDALNRGVEVANGEILVFSDANAMYDSTALVYLIENFGDPEIGGVCGRKGILAGTGRSSSAGDSLFWKVESTLKLAESAIGSIPTADGEIFAIRKALFKELPTNTINDDTAITFDIVNQGYRVVYEPRAISRELASITLREDMAVKARMVYGGYQSLVNYRAMLLPPRDWFALQFIVHKTLRHMMPFLLVLLFLSNLALTGGFYGAFLLCQVAFYLVAGMGAILQSAGASVKWAYVPLYYCAMNVSALTGFAYFIKGRALTEVWTKAAR